MAENDVNSDIDSENDSILGLDISSDGTIRPFMFEPQHGSSSEEEGEFSMVQGQLETGETEAERTFRSRLGHREWCICGNCQIMPTETESICCQEMDVLGDRLDLEGKKSTIPITERIRITLHSMCSGKIRIKLVTSAVIIVVYFSRNAA